MPSTPRASRPQRRPLWRNLALVAAVLVLVGLLAGVGVFLAGGGRGFIVATPSMGTAAPVGTLVLTEPSSIGRLHVGDVISFHPPTAPSETYTHRVHDIRADGTVSTKGDINGSADPWRLHQSDLVGKAIVIAPGLGWLARGLPILVLGTLIVFLLTRLVASRQWRAALRIVGVALVFSVGAWILRPFTGLQLIATTAAHGNATATVVSTGILPIRVSAEHGTQVDLVSGQVGQVSIPTMLHDDYYRIASALHLDVGGWILLILICLLPFLATLIIGLPGRDPVVLGERHAGGRHDEAYVARKLAERRVFDDGRFA